MDPNDAAPLKALDFNEEQANMFLTQLTDKYGKQFSQAPGFKIYIKSQLQLKSDKPHAIRFDGLLKLHQNLLAPIQTTSVGRQGLFAQAAGRSNAETDQQDDSMVEADQLPGQSRP